MLVAFSRRYKVIARCVRLFLHGEKSLREWRREKTRSGKAVAELRALFYPVKNVVAGCRALFHPVKNVVASCRGPFYTV